MSEGLITLRAQAELVRVAHAPMIVRDLDDRIVLWNPAAEALYGWTSAEAVGRVSHVLLCTEFPQPLDELTSALLQNGRWEGDLVHRARDGRKLIVSSRWAVQRDERGLPSAVLEVNLDMTERRRAEEAQGRFAFLAEASALLSTSLDYETTLASVARLAVPHIADWCTVDMLAGDGSIQLLAVAHADPEKVRWAEALRQRYPVDPDTQVGLPQVLRTGRSELYPVIDDAMLQATAHNAEELEILRAVGYESGMVVPLTVRGRTIGAITLVSAGSGRHYGLPDLELAENLARHAALAIDNSQLYRQVQRLNENLERRADRLESANRELEAFAYSVSHDLRSPLRAIDGFSRILIDDFGAELGAEPRHYLGLVRENARQMGELIDDLLAFSRLGRQPLQKRRVEPGELVRQAMAELESERVGRQVEILVGDLPPWECDPGLMRQVFVNLLSNALKFTRRRAWARIEVGSLLKQGDLVYFVRDNGVGFDMRYADKLFGVFQRLHRAEDYEGTGAGLAIVQRIIYRHGGRIWAESQVDQGATFYFTLPA